MNRMDFAARLKNIAPSQSLAVIAEVRELRRAGVEIIDFGQQGLDLFKLPRVRPG